MTGPSGAAVVWEKRYSYIWQEQKDTLGKSKEILLDAEMWGISEAFIYRPFPSPPKHFELP